MLDRFGRHVRQQFMGYVALFIAMGGMSYAAVTLPKNSVASKQLKNGQVKRPDLARNAVTGPKVKNGSLRGADFKAGELPAGPRGEPGPAGPPGTFGTIRTRRTTVSVGDGGGAGGLVGCEPGERAIGGGASFDESTDPALSVLASRPSDSVPTPLESGSTFTHWTGYGTNPVGGAMAEKLSVWVICAGT